MRMTRYILLVLSLLVGIFTSSCKLGQKYTRPDLHLPENFNGTDIHDTLSVQDIRWWDIYTDTVLQKLIRQTLTYNKDLQIAAARVKESELARRITRADLYPKINLATNAEREYDEKPGNAFEGKITTTTWEIDLWGKLRWANQESLAAYLQTKEGQRALQMSLVAQVARAYFELCALDMELSIVKQTHEARRESVRLAKLRFEGGLTSETAFRQAQVELAKTKTLIPDLEQKIKLKENDISLLTGQYPGDIPRGKNINSQTMPDSLPVGLPSSLLERRPDIRQAEYNLRAANTRVGIAYTSMFPSLTLTGTYGLESSELKNFLSTPYFYISGKLLGPIFQMGKVRAKYKAAQAAYEQEVYSYEKSVLTAFKEVNNALVSFTKTREIKTTRKRLEEAAYSYKELANLQYINGVISYLDVLDAQRGYFDAQISFNNAVRDELISIVNLYMALGGGWDTGE